MQLSVQQAAFIDFLKNSTSSCVLEAVAGSGKTTTLITGIKELISQGKSCLVVAFNKSIAKEIEGKIGKLSKELGIDPSNMWRHARGSTCHAIAFGAYRKRFPNVQVDGNKVYDIVTQMVENDETLAPYQSAVIKLVSIAKQSGLGIKGMADDRDVTNWIDLIDHFAIMDNMEDDFQDETALARIGWKVLKESNKSTDIVDYDDMIYLTLMYDLKFFQVDVVMVDEAQDINPVRRELVRRLVKKNGRVIAVGDRNQAIYGFTGADADSLDLIKTAFKTHELPLSVSFRCPKNVVSFAQKWVSHIEAHADAIDGTVSTIPYNEFSKREDINEDAAMLCRNTAPLVEVAYALIRAGKACRVEGRDIGKGLIKLAQRWKITTTDALRKKLEAYKEREVKKAQAKKNAAREQQIDDQVATLNIIIDAVNAEQKHNITDVVSFIDNLFGDTAEGEQPACFTLSTIHKSKGREWKTVFWLDRVGTLPSKYCTQNWQFQQEDNLCYVAATRAMENLVEVMI